MALKKRPTALDLFRLQWKGMNQREVAKKLGITPSYMNDIWLGRRRLTAKILRKTTSGQALFFRQATEEARREWERGGL